MHADAVRGAAVHGEPRLVVADELRGVEERGGVEHGRSRIGPAQAGRQPQKARGLASAGVAPSADSGRRQISVACRGSTTSMRARSIPVRRATSSTEPVARSPPPVTLRPRDDGVAPPRGRSSGSCSPSSDDPPCEPGEPRRIRPIGGEDGLRSIVSSSSRDDVRRRSASSSPANRPSRPSPSSTAFRRRPGLERAGGAVDDGKPRDRAVVVGLDEEVGEHAASRRLGPPSSIAIQSGRGGAGTARPVPSRQARARRGRRRRLAATRRRASRPGRRRRSRGATRGRLRGVRPGRSRRPASRPAPSRRSGRLGEAHADPPPAVGGGRVDLRGIRHIRRRSPGRRRAGQRRRASGASSRRRPAATRPVSRRRRPVAVREPAERAHDCTPIHSTVHRSGSRAGAESAAAADHRVGVDLDERVLRRVA